MKKGRQKKKWDTHIEQIIEKRQITEQQKTEDSENKKKWHTIIQNRT